MKPVGTIRRDQKKEWTTDGRTTAHLNKYKVGSFISLFEKIKEVVGSHEGAAEAIKICNRVIYDMKNDNILSKRQAKKILDTYNRIVKKLK